MRPKYVICAAGIAGRPGIDWCETHQPETIMVNVVGQLNVADACARRGIHVTLFGTGSLYCYDEQHPMGSGRGFKEEDAPNFDGNFYVRMRTRLEELLRSFSNVLNLRVVFPITSDMHPRSIIPKLVSYRRIVSVSARGGGPELASLTLTGLALCPQVPTAFTVMDDLFPLIPRMADKGLTGTFNFVNPGVTSNGAIMQMYRRIVDPSHTWEDVPPEQQTSVTAVKRPYSELDMRFVCVRARRLCRWRLRAVSLFAAQQADGALPGHCSHRQGTRGCVRPHQGRAPTAAQVRAVSPPPPPPIALAIAFPPHSLIVFHSLTLLARRARARARGLARGGDSSGRCGRCSSARRSAALRGTCLGRAILKVVVVSSGASLVSRPGRLVLLVALLVLLRLLFFLLLLRPRRLVLHRSGARLPLAVSASRRAAARGARLGRRGRRLTGLAHSSARRVRLELRQRVALLGALSLLAALQGRATFAPG